MTVRRVALLGIAVVLAPACQEELLPRGHLVLHVDTDAVVPQSDGVSGGPTRLAVMVDRVLFDVLVRGQAVAGASRTFAVDERMLSDGRLSIGVVPPPGSTDVSARVRLFRADRVTETEPPPGVTLDTTVALPPVPDEGRTDVNVVLRVADFGKRIGPVPASPGTASHAAVGTYGGARRRRCEGVAGPEETCVPGGTFFFGYPAFRGRTSGNDIFEERLVEVSPFYLDRTEVTAGAFKRVWPTLAARGLPAPISWSGTRSPTGTEASWCTFSADAVDVEGAPLDARPLSCISWETASAYCAELGKELPSEVEHEYVTSGLGAEWSFVWGDAEPTCTDAIWGRAGVGAFSVFASTCRPPASIGWVAFPGSGTADKLGGDVLGGGTTETVVDLAGNLGEWMRDFWARPTEGIWGSHERATDPWVDAPVSVDGSLHVLRGGDWATSTTNLRAGYRIRRPSLDTTPRYGFRCRRRGTP